jgi:hypothetical protein
MKRLIFAISAAVIISVAAFATSNATLIAPIPTVADNVIQAYYYHGHYYPFRHHGRSLSLPVEVVCKTPDY